METNCERNCPSKADCCKFMLIAIGDDKESDYIRWASLHKDIKLVEWRGLICIKLLNKCSMLKHNRCSIYEDRPQMCRSFKCSNNFD